MFITNMSLHKWYSKESFHCVDQFLELFPVFTSERVRLALAQQTHKKINVRFVIVVFSDCINMSARDNIGQVLKIKLILVENQNYSF